MFCPSANSALDTVTENDGSVERAIKGVSAAGVSKTHETETESEETEVKLTDDGTEAFRAPVKKADTNAKMTLFCIPLYIIDNINGAGKVTLFTCDLYHINATSGDGGQEAACKMSVPQLFIDQQYPYIAVGRFFPKHGYRVADA